MDAAPKLKTGHVMQPCPFQRQFVVCRLGLTTINVYTKFEVCVHSLQRYDRWQKM